MPKGLSKRAANIKPSPTLAVDAKAKALKAQGVDVVGFGAGEPDFDTPDNIKEFAIKAIRDGFTKYCPVDGTPDLKKAVITRINTDYGVEYKPEEIIVSCGGKHSLYNIAQALFEKGDEILIPSPYWVSYPDIVMLADAKPKFIKTKESSGFKIIPEQLKKAIKKRTRALILNSPSNPTGATYTEDELKPILEIALNADIWIISDEIYDKLVYDGLKYRSIPSFGEEVKKRTLLVNGVSKAYAMTGWRIGYTAGDAKVVKAMANIQSQSTSNPASISLKAATEAFIGPQDFVEKMRIKFDERRKYIVKTLNSIKGISCSMPPGSFYVFPKISRLFGKSYNGKQIGNSMELAEFLLDVAKVAVVPGAPFGDDRYMRLSYATSMENITKGLERIRETVDKLK
ncbi:MAG TPA: pyridoxal phosphate-dependent aminotransferase [bacterium]